MSPIRLLVVTALLSFGAVSCGGSPSVPPDGGAVSDGGAQSCDPQPDGGQCNALSLGAAPTVVVTRVAAAVPTFTGGTIANGLYYLTSLAIHTGPGGATGPTTGTQKSALQISGGSSLQLVQSVNGCPSRSLNATVTTSGTSMILNATCPALGSASSPFTATSTTLLLYAEGDGVATFTRQ